MNDKIDAVILFVDMNDHNWRTLYNSYVLKNEIPDKFINNEQRFRDYGSLKCVLRSIDLYASWINNVYLVVQSESQVPKWINKSEVKVVLHEDFIPKKYLPTFNCNTIETHLHLIPGISEKFIYFNDDTILNSVNYPADYFIGDKCVHHIMRHESNRITNSFSNWYTHLRYSNIKEICKATKNNTILEDVFYNSHGPTPMLKTICEEIYRKIDIENHTTTFREKTNLTQELFTVYALYKRKLIWLKNDTNKNYTSKETNKQYLITNHIDFIQNLFSEKYKTFCANDVFTNSELKDVDLVYNEINKILHQRFNMQSKYEHTRVANCLPVKNENKYLREFVEYYKNLGYDNIILYDNNDINGEYPQEVIKDYIDEGFVIYNDVRGEEKCQLRINSECLVKYQNVFEWISFFDCDEFLVGVNNIHNILDITPSNSQQIYINWEIYGDNGLKTVTDDNYNVLERFYCPENISPFDKFKGVGKPIIRNTVSGGWESHLCPHIIRGIITTDADGNYVKDVKRQQLLSKVKIAHFYTKTLEEYIERCKYDVVFEVNEKYTKSRMDRYYEMNPKSKL